MFLKKKTLLTKIILAGILITTLATCAPNAAPAPLTPTTLQLAWTHVADHAGFYAADLNGYYADEGLSITFEQGGPEIDPKASVLNGSAQFGIVTADDLILARGEEEPLRGIATIQRRSPVVFFALADSGITSPQDFVGKSIRVVYGLYTPLRAMMSFIGINPDQYTEVVLPSDLAEFTSGEVPVWGAYLTQFVVSVQQAGHELNIIYPDNYGVHFYANSIFTTEDLISSNPDLVARFLRASLKGWTYAVENPGEVGAMVAKYNLEADPALENEKMIASLPLVNTGEDHIGWMKEEAWVEMEKTMREQGVLIAPVDVTQVYDMQFLEEIYK